MLTMTMIAAISVVALPHLRITTLCVMRAKVLAYALASFVLMQGNIPAVMDIFGQAISVDTLGTYMMLVAFVIIGVVVSFYTVRVLALTGTPYTVVILITVIAVGAYYMAISADFVTVALSLEIQSFSLYALTALYRWREGATSAGLMYFMLGAFSSGLVLLGMSLAYAYTGESRLAQLGIISLYTNDRFITTALVITMSGLLFKVTAAPFHYWGPEVYDRTPTVITTFINIIPKFGLMVLIVRFSTVLASTGMETYLGWIVVLSWSFGSIVGLVQTRIKRLLAYSTVSHVGWIAASIIGGTSIGFGALMFYLLQYSASTALTFLCLIAISYALGIHDKGGVSSSYRDVSQDVEVISTLNGLSVRSAILPVMIAATLFSAAGIPPMVGFFAKLSIMQGLLYAFNPLYVVLGVLGSIISAGFYLGVVSAILFKPNVD